MWRQIRASLTRARERMAWWGRPVVDVGCDGLLVTKSGVSRKIRWEEITRIAAFRQDIYLGLVVCVAIEALDGSNVYIMEGDAAYGKLYDVLKHALPSLLPLEDWLFDLTQGRTAVAYLYERPSDD